MPPPDYVPNYGNGRAVTCGSALRDLDHARCGPATLAEQSERLRIARQCGYDEGFRDGCVRDWLTVAAAFGVGLAVGLVVMWWAMRGPA